MAFIKYVDDKGNIMYRQNGFDFDNNKLIGFINNLKEIKDY